MSDPYPGTIPASMPCKACGIKPIPHGLITDHAYLASWLDIEGIDPASIPEAVCER